MGHPVHVVLLLLRLVVVVVCCYVGVLHLVVMLLSLAPFVGGS